jgi:predicted DNA-binding ribbon-helix-helix protein
MFPQCGTTTSAAGTTSLSDCCPTPQAQSSGHFVDRHLQKSLNAKRSVVIGRHKTSVSLEDAFWKGFNEIAASRNITLSDLLATIDTGRNYGGLSSAIRLFVLEHYRAQVDARKSAERPIDEKGRSAHRAAPHHQ